MGRVLEGEASNCGVMSASALPFFHVLRACDATLSIFGKSKNTFYDRWKFFPEIFCETCICAVKKWNIQRRYCLIRTILCCDVQCYKNRNRCKHM